MMKKIMAMILSIMLAIGLLPASTNAATATILRLTKTTKGIEVRLEKAGSIQSVQLSIKLEKDKLEDAAMQWDSSLDFAYKHIEVQKNSHDYTVTFYVDSKQIIGNDQSITLGSFQYTGYSKNDTITSDGAVKTLNLAIQEKSYQAAVRIETEGSNSSHSGNTVKPDPENNQSGNNKKTDALEPAVKGPKSIKVKSNEKELELVQLTTYWDAKLNQMKVELPQLSLENKKQTVKVKAVLDQKTLINAIKNKKAKSIRISVMQSSTMEKNSKIQFTGLYIQPEVLKALKAKKSKAVFELRNTEKRLLYSITIDGKKIKKTGSSNLNLALKSEAAKKNALLKNKAYGSQGAVLTFDQNTSLKTACTVKFYASQYGIKRKDVLHVNQYDTKKKALIYQGRGYQMSKDGYVSVPVFTGGIYAISTVGFVPVKGKIYYYVGKNMKKGMVVINGGCYYFSQSNGAMVKKKFLTIKGKRYYFGKSGKAVTGKQKINGKYYVFNKKGQMISSR